MGDSDVLKDILSLFDEQCTRVKKNIPTQNAQLLLPENREKDNIYPKPRDENYRLLYRENLL
jgi:hypothetical protein